MTKKRSQPSKAGGEQQKNSEESDESFPIVGIGASAGGLGAFKQLFERMPSDTGIAFALIQHLDPTHQSLTAELLNKHTKMSVVEVADKMPVEKNHVYVIPPNKYLSIHDMTLHLSDPGQRRGMRVPIDFFFNSLAEDQRERSIGIILTGTGTDGTLGAREIKAAGGMVMVQSPESAQFDGMPRSAIETGAVDYVLAVEEMPEPLMRYVKHWYVDGHKPPKPATEATPDQLADIVGLLRARTKYDFGCYKKGTLTRRIQRRMGLNHIENMDEYVQLLRDDADEINALYKDMLIGVTNFFREPETWDVLQRKVIQPLVEAREPGEAIRVWVPGCTTGEEAYSIAMLLFESLHAADKMCDIQIFASDIDADALAFARDGLYPENIAAHITPERLRQFFTKGQHAYRINKELRETVVFAEQNVISDPPFSKQDLISCRNLLIYLEPEVQKKIIAVFHFALREGGFLILGGSETIGQQKDLFEPVSRKGRIYQRVGGASHPKVEIPVAGIKSRRDVPKAQTDFAPMPRLASLAQHLVMQRFSPACAVVNHKNEVLYLTGPVDDYLQLPTGEIGQDLLAMARDGLRAKLRACLRKAIQDDKPVTASGLRVKRSGKYYPTRITIEPLKHPKEAENLYLVVFEGDTTAGQGGVADSHSEPNAAVAESDTAEDRESIIRQLEEDLRITREELQTTVEEMETSNEEFTAANEEISSINEEVQSTNEELETSKEELQSLNEELQTVNNQLEQKIAEAESTNNDLNNLLASTDIATIFLDRDFRLRRFTPSAAQLFRVIDTDVGRPISDLAQDVADDHLLSDADAVLQKLTPVEKEVQDKQNRWYLRRITPFRTEDDRISGVVVTFTDITARKQHETALHTINQELDEHVRLRTIELQRISRELKEKQIIMQAMLDSTGDGVAVVDNEGKNLIFNPAGKRLVGIEISDIPIEKWSETYGVYRSDEATLIPTDQLPVVRAMRGEEVRDAECFIKNEQQPDGVWLSISASPLRDEDGPIIGGVCVFRDITLRKHVDETRARLAAVVESSPMAIIVCKLDGVIENWNRQAEKMFGYSEREAVGCNIDMLLPPHQSDEFAKQVERLREGQSVDEYETIRLNNKGKPVDVSITMSLVRDDSDQPIRVCKIIRETGVRKRLEQEVAEQADHERQFLAQELHDSVGQLLTGMSLMVSSLHDKLTEENSPHASVTAQIEDATTGIKTELRAISRGLLPLGDKRDGLVQAIHELVRHTEETFALHCRFEYDDDLPELDPFAASHLYRIVQEAVHNTAKHAHAEALSIQLHMGDFLVLSIEDRGDGFEHNEDSQGMGLRIMKYRAGLIGAKFELSSVCGQGTRIVCTLPASTTERNDDPEG